MPVTFWIFEGTSENFRKYHQKNKENGWKGKTTVVFTNVHLMYGIHFSVTQKGRHPTENHTSRTFPSQSTAKELSEICVQNFHFLLQNETTSPHHQATNNILAAQSCWTGIYEWFLGRDELGVAIWR